jgi:hypothetical protein
VYGERTDGICVEHHACRFRETTSWNSVWLVDIRSTITAYRLFRSDNTDENLGATRIFGEGNISPGQIAEAGCC